MTRNAKQGRFSSLTRRSFVKRLTAGTAAVTIPTAAYSGSAAAQAGEPVDLQYFDYGDYGPQGGHWNHVRWSAESLANARYGSVWVQSPCEPNTGSSNGYNPRDFMNWDGDLGTESEFDDMLSRLGDNGVGVIVDTIVNHTATTDPDEGVYPQFPDRSYFHDPMSLDEDRVRGQLVGLWSLDHWNGDVTQRLEDYVRKIGEKGAAGIRWDAAKHVPQWWFNYYGSRWADEYNMFQVGEVWDGDLDLVMNYTEAGMNVFDFQLQNTLNSAFSYGGNLSEVANAIRNDQCVLGRNPFRASVFVDNHDLSPDDTPDDYRLAHAFMLTAPGAAMVYANRTKPDDGVDDPTAPWLTNLNWIKENLAGGSMYFRHDDDNLLVHERENNLLTGINKAGYDQTQWVYTTWRNQVLQDYTGTMGDVWVNGDGWCNIEIPAQDWVCYAP